MRFLRSRLRLRLRTLLIAVVVVAIPLAMFATLTRRRTLDFRRSILEHYAWKAEFWGAVAEQRFANGEYAWSASLRQEMRESAAWYRREVERFRRGYLLSVPAEEWSAVLRESSRREDQINASVDAEVFQRPGSRPPLAASPLPLPPTPARDE